MNDEDTRAAPIMIEQKKESVTGKKAANCFVDYYEQISVPEDRKRQVRDEIKNRQDDQNSSEYMNQPLNMKELEGGLRTLQSKKSPGRDKITNEMLEHFGYRAKSILLAIFNNSWKTGHVPQSWREADIVPIYKKGKDRTKADG